MKFIVTILLFIVSVNADAKLSAFLVANQYNTDVKLDSGYLGSVTIGQTETITNYGAGLGLQIPINSKWNFEIDAIYLGRGYKDTTTEYSWWNLQIPLMGRIWQSSTLSGLVGVVATNAMGEQKQKVILTGMESEKSIDEVMSATDMSAVIGIGLNLNNFLLDLRMTFGLTDLDKDSTSTTSKEIQLLVGWYF